MATPEDCPMVNSPLVQASGWHLKKEFQLGHIVSSLVILVSVVLYVTTIEKRLTVVENNLASQTVRDERQDKTASEAISMVRSDIQGVSAKLDRLIERTK